MQLCDPGLSGLLREEFEAHGIPCFLDEKRPVMLKTVCRFGLALLKCAVSGMARDDVLALLKTGMFPVSEEEAAFVNRGARQRSAALGPGERCALVGMLFQLFRPLPEYKDKGGAPQAEAEQGVA
mgnify:CR=1 FL=1